MAAVPDHLSANEDVYEARHRKLVRSYILYAVATVAGIAILLAPFVLPVPGRPRFQDPFFIVSVLVMLGLAAMILVACVQGPKVHVRFTADGEGFQPNRFVPARRLSRLARRWVPMPRVRYEEVASAVHEPAADAPGGEWWIFMRLRDGSDVWLAADSEIPDEAYPFLLEQLRRRGIPAVLDEDL